MTQHHIVQGTGEKFNLGGDIKLRVDHGGDGWLVFWSILGAGWLVASGLHDISKALLAIAGHMGGG